MDYHKVAHILDTREVVGFRFFLLAQNSSTDAITEFDGRCIGDRQSSVTGFDGVRAPVYIRKCQRTPSLPNSTEDPHTCYSRGVRRTSYCKSSLLNLIPGSSDKIELHSGRKNNPRAKSIGSCTEAEYQSSRAFQEEGF
ncbi:hypothetical protein PI125_g12804 [Phytophthora idaei]|nr:hypothetical protein PI125_g12804 [Phytophthora idaei]